MQPKDADVIVVGAGLAGLVATAELVDAGRSVILVEQEGAQNLGGQAWWSFGGLFLVDSPEQRRLRVKDSVDLAWQDWLGTAGFDRTEDDWARRWAEAYVHFAAGEKRAWLQQLGHRFFPVVGWAERGGYGANGPGNSVPRFHITWGTGPGITAPFEARVRDGVERGLVRFAFRHRLDDLVLTGGAVTGVRGSVLEPTTAPRGTASSRTVVGGFEFTADAVVLTTGGIGGDHDAVRAAWPQRMGAAPGTMLSGVPEYVDGRGIGIASAAGGRVINPDRMWHYVEGIRNWDPVWKNHGIRILPGPSSLWLDAAGRRLPVPLFPGFDTLGTLEHLRGSGFDYSWFILNKAIIRKEFALSGSEQNPDLTGKSLRDVLKRATAGVPAPVQAFLDHGEDFITADSVEDLVAGMNRLAKSSRGDAPELSAGAVRHELESRDREIRNPFTKDSQVTAIRGARTYLGDRLIRTAAPHAILDPKAGPLIAVRLSVLTRKSLGGLQTDLQSRVLADDGAPVPGLFAAGEAAGFGGGGMHGYRSLEGTFLGGCLFSGRAAGRAAAG
ncbi:FAD-binding dehydrogenase [Arthrobacter yangruifuii]|uniref:FAD-binding dehydrogenase n=1 Tax=Arthrobacter yangruifuii TaxID=2606616 RepID=A0A5N6MFF7_9MICC|nr:FAD-binding dehydrogenase [Arthrobacter yangruifuii]KAD3514953.1 FAD-binding dehydrogenase [Arthrobacter yangruifuii]